MARGQDNGAKERLARVGFDTLHLVALNEQGVHACLKMHFAAALKNGVAHVLDDAGQLVGADVRMGVHQDGGGSTVLAEDVEYLVHIAALLAAGVELAVGVGSRTTFAEAVVRLRVHGLGAADLCQVFLTLAHVLATLHHHGAQAQLDEAQGGKEATGAGTHNDDLRTTFHIGVVRVLVFVVAGHFVDVGPHGEVHEDRPLAGVDAPLQDAGGVEGSLVKAFLAYEIGFQLLFVGGYLG